MASLSNVVVAVEAVVAEAKQKLFDDLKNFIMGELDEDSVEAIKELFDKFQENNAKSFEAPVAPKAKKGGKKGAAPDGEEKPAKAKRAPSEYNKFVSEKMKELRAEDETLSAKAAMQKAMGMWKDHKASLATASTSEN